jgi:hypothetical protein
MTTITDHEATTAIHPMPERRAPVWLRRVLRSLSAAFVRHYRRRSEFRAWRPGAAQG